MFSRPELTGYLEKGRNEQSLVKAFFKIYNESGTDD